MSSNPDRPGFAAHAADVSVVCGLVLLGAGVYFLDRFEGVDGPARERVLRLAVLILCALVAGLWMMARRSRRQLRRIDEMLTDVLFGAGTKRDREALDILVRALRAPDASARTSALQMIRKISGLDLGDDPEAWEGWWKVSRATFVRSGPGPKGAGAVPKKS